MKPELKEFLLRLLNDKANIEESFAAFINANFAAYLQDNFALLIAVKKITDPTENLLKIGKYTRDSEEIANISSEQQAAAILVFIEYCYSELTTILNKSSQPDPQLCLPYIQVLAFFAEKLKAVPEIAKNFTTIFPNFIEINSFIEQKIIGSSPETANKKAVPPIQNTILQDNNSAADPIDPNDYPQQVTIAEIDEERAIDHSDPNFFPPIDFGVLKINLEKILKENTGSIFHKHPKISSLLSEIKNKTLDLDSIQEFSDKLLSLLKPSKPEERKVYLQLTATILDNLAKQIKLTPLNTQLTKTYNLIKINLYKLQTLNKIVSYIESRKGKLTKYIFSDFYYRAANKGEKDFVPKDSKRYKTTFLFGDIDNNIMVAKTAQDYLEIIKNIQLQLAPFYDLSNNRYHNAGSVSKGLLHDLQEETLAILKSTFPNSPCLKTAENIVENAFYAKLKDDLYEYKNNRQSIKNAFGVIRDKITDAQRVQFFNYTDWLLSNLEILSKKLEIDPSNISTLTSDQKIQFYFQFIEASAYILKLVKDKDSDFENSLYNTQYSIINKLIAEVSNKSAEEKQNIYRKLSDIVEYQRPDSAAGRKLKELFTKAPLPALKLDSNRSTAFTKRFEKEMQERYQTWQAVEDSRRNKVKVAIFTNSLIGYLKEGMRKLAKGKALDPSIFDTLAKGVGVVIPTPEVKISVQAVGAVYKAYQVANPELLDTNAFEALSENQKDNLITIIVDRFLQIYQQKISMLHFDTSKNGRETLNEVAFYAADRLLHFLERIKLGDNQSKAKFESQILEARKNNTLPEYVENGLNQIFEALETQPYSHSQIKPKSTTVRLQNQSNIKVNTGRGFDANDFFLSGRKLVINKENHVDLAPPPRKSLFADSEPAIPPKIFFGYVCHFWNPPIAPKTAQNNPEVTPTAAPSFSR